MICLSLSIDNLKVIDWFFTDGRAGVSCGATHWPDSVRILCDFSVVSVDLLQWITLVCVCVCVEREERRRINSVQVTELKCFFLLYWTRCTAHKYWRLTELETGKIKEKLKERKKSPRIRPSGCWIGRWEREVWRWRHNRAATGRLITETIASDENE